MEVVRLRKVSKRYGRREILADVDLQLNAGELLALVGANGSGKSTVLRLMVGLSRPSAGTVHRNAGVVSYVPDVFTSHDRLSASAYLRHMGRIRGLSTRTARDRSLELLDRLALSGGADTPMRKLSKGNAQKVALAQALLDPPQLLVLDEPWAGLDATAHSTLRELLTETAEQGAAVAFTEHSAEVVRSTATRVCELDRGSLTSLRQQPALTELHLIPVTAHLNGAGVDWERHPDVLEVRRTEGGVTVLLPTGRHDAALLTALNHGWSVVSVRQVKAE
ncbi:ABC-type multidrug transport system ATPase subunit [Kribbella sp. VKM Ac-2569]|uniref:ABC transporter ATP-binding protein n=1 Tax=Kribbella sp. VKM Ac-2569 TaxID=2512220 RepID=UPI00102BD963|nr:ATP-binding cassette domain-containing protein [Kribbella sp. VKM Ac-2569]RZT12035.1 ABC-type multidrug transport system ATPase subunit [Kribbella sp. VKM Ac-2569]